MLARVRRKGDGVLFVPGSGSAAFRIGRLWACALTLVLAAPALAQSDYSRERREAGIEAYRRGHFARAEAEWRLAAFTSTDDPPHYMESLAYLTVALDAQGRQKEVGSTVGRFLSTEAVHSAYSASALDADLRGRFQAILLRTVPRERIERLPHLAAELGLTPAGSRSPAPAVGASATPVPSETPTPAPAITATATEVPTELPAPSPTETFPRSPTETPSPPPSPTEATASPTATRTFTATPTWTSTRTPSGAPTSTPTETASRTPTETATRTLTASLTPTRTMTASPTSTRTLTASPSPTITHTATATSTRTATPSSTRTPTPTSTRTATAIPSATPTATRVPSPTPSSTPTRTTSPSPSPSPSPSRTPSPTPTATYAPSSTPTATATPRPTETRSPTATPLRPTPTPIFVRPGSLESPPRAVERVMPIYPDEALRKRIRGLVVLRVLVSENGEPLEIHVEQGRADLAKAAVEAVRQWRFEPGKWKGVAVRTFATVRIPFEAIPFARTPFPESRTPARPR